MFRKSLFPFLLAVLLLSTACSTGKPEGTVASFLDALKKGEFKKSDTYTEMPLFNDFDSEEGELLKLYLQSYEYTKPVVVEKTDSTATVQVDLTATNLYQVVETFMRAVMERATQDNKTLEEMNDSELDAMLKQAITAPDAPKKSMTVTMNLVRVGSGLNKKWTILVNDNLKAGLFMQDPSDTAGYPHDSEGDEYEIVEEATAAAVPISTDSTAGLCEFTIDGQNFLMYCDDAQIKILSTNLNKKLQIEYQVFSRGDTGGQIYVLTNITP